MLVLTIIHYPAMIVSKIDCADLWVIICPCNYYPTDETLLASHNYIAINMANVQTSYIS